jgi:hypothetical protein
MAPRPHLFPLLWKALSKKSDWQKTVGTRLTLRAFDNPKIGCC